MAEYKVRSEQDPGPMREVPPVEMRLRTSIGGCVYMEARQLGMWVNVAVPQCGGTLLMSYLTGADKQSLPSLKFDEYGRWVIAKLI